MSNPKTCAHCAHFLASQKVTGGICRRYPPVAMLLQQTPSFLGAGAMDIPRTGMAGVSPPVDLDHTCGEWRDAAPALATAKPSRYDELLKRDGK